MAAWVDGVLGRRGVGEPVIDLIWQVDLSRRMMIQGRDKGSHEGERKLRMIFEVKIDPMTAHDSYSAWWEQDHGDLVLSLQR